ncbi:helix-turn-helix domain-containing protein [Mangrovicoccus sp. HB182678]|uniref:Helix-turn-helix domain-containing protein n=1 Tax=Mangrovicoccus algicola TaxID=2771008 RepID=A0A8J7CJ26_9RHOB|nr:helix-turn-helix domain-containing protein [Mangrovicoccus algicola]
MASAAVLTIKPASPIPPTLRRKPCRPRSGTSSPIRSLEILELLAENGPLGHTAISGHLEIPKSTATALRKDLRSAGYVLRDEDRKFTLSPGC